MTAITPEVVETLAQAGALDDRARMLLGLLASQQAEHGGDEPDELDNGAVAPVERRTALTARLRLLTEELGELRHRNLRLAEALGACPACWGESPECPDCRGRGSPGTYPPDPDLYRAVVAPAALVFTSPSVRAATYEEGARHG